MIPRSRSASPRESAGEAAGAARAPGSAASTCTPWEEPVERLAAGLASDLARGLAPAEAARRLACDGPNELRKTGRVSAVALACGQFRSVLVWVLLGAAVVAAALGERLDSLAITAIVLLNAAMGFVHEYRADRAAAALARLAAPRARVVRGGRSAIVAAAEVVRGDLVLLEAGDVVAADARLVEVFALRTNEAALTGESQPVDKGAGTLSGGAALADRTNMVFLGTSVVGGAGRALVVATGMGTEVGRIADLLSAATRDETPLEREVDHVARRLLWPCAAIVVLVFLLGLWRSVAPFDLFLAAISLAVAAIPEGLPTVITVALALGVQRMARRRALVRRLPSVETLGCAQVICTDKTGTLTLGEMTARRVVTSGRTYAVTGDGYSTEGGFFDGAGGAAGTEDRVLLDLLRAGVACNGAELARVDGRPAIVGDPTEGALLVLAAKAGIRREEVESRMPRRGLLAFDPDRKRMTVVRERDGGPWAFVKGAPEVILERCALLQRASGVERLTAGDRASLLGAGAVLASEGLRVLAVAERPLDPSSFPNEGPLSEADIERDLILLGLVGLQDPPRPEAGEAVRRCRAAGIRTVMITGDHPDTARAIARELGILGRDDEAVLGVEVERLSDRELAERVHRIAVYARVTAEHKLRIVRAWKSRGVVVAMTGDGVNDAPALREASIGVAMGVTGTEVTKEAADLIITDDNFASIVNAVEEGRGIYDNISKTFAYLLAGNAGELAVMLVAGVIGWPLPLLPVHLLWINLVTDGLPALALATDPVDPGVLARPPRDLRARLLDGAVFRRTALIGGLTAATALIGFGWELRTSGDLAHARDAAFSVLVGAELLRSFGARSDTRTVWQIGLFSNLRLAAIVAASYALQLAIHHLPALQAVFGVAPVSLGRCAGWLALGAVPLIALEVGKARRAARRPRHDPVVGGTA